MMLLLPTQQDIAQSQSGVPAQIRQAILLMVTDAYDNRQDYIKRLPTASEYLLDQYRVQVL
jgi:hypothetical protein